MSSSSCQHCFRSQHKTPACFSSCSYFHCDQLLQRPQGSSGFGGSSNINSSSGTMSGDGGAKTAMTGMAQQPIQAWQVTMQAPHADAAEVQCARKPLSSK
eukprot:6200822-Pleurochrysis_carterae.AAC.1